jgi:hypothetical protein
MDSLLSWCSSSIVQRWNSPPTLTLCRCYEASHPLLRAYRVPDQRRSIRLYSTMEDRGREKPKTAILGAYRPLNDSTWTILPAMSEFDLCFPTGWGKVQQLFSQPGTVNFKYFISTWFGQLFCPYSRMATKRAQKNNLFPSQTVDEK